MRELLVKVPAPFSGVDDVGFTARHPSQDLSDALKDIPVIVEGSSQPMHILVNHLSLLAAREDPLGEDEGYRWSPPICISDEICVMSFRDLSHTQEQQDLLLAGRQYLWNLIRPLAFTFLRDCVRVGQLKLRDQIDVIIADADQGQIGLVVNLRDIIDTNGTDLLYVA